MLWAHGAGLAAAGLGVLGVAAQELLFYGDMKYKEYDIATTDLGFPSMWCLALGSVS